MTARDEQSLKSSEAGIRAKRAGLVGLAARAVSVAALAITLPVALEALGEERFGLWMLITSLVMSFGFLDLGLANGMLTSLAEASGRTDDQRVREILATGVLLLTALGASILVLSGIAAPYIDWHAVLNVTDAVDPAELQVAMIVLIALVAIGVPVSAVQRIYFGLQRGIEANIWLAAGAIFSLIGTLIAAESGANLAIFVAATVGGPLLAGLLGGLVLLVGPRGIRPLPTVHDLRKEQARRLGRDGLLYLTLQATAALAMYSDNAILAATLGTSDLAAFSTAGRVFGVVNMIAAVMAYPLWAAFGLAAARGDRAWIRATFGNALLKTVGFAVVATSVLAVAFVPLVKLWLGPAAPAFPTTLIASFAVWTVVQSVGAVTSSLLNAIRAVRFQVLVALIFTPVCLWLKWRLAIAMGPAGIVIAASAAYILIALVPHAVYLRRKLVVGSFDAADDKDSQRVR